MNTWRYEILSLLSNSGNGIVCRFGNEKHFHHWQAFITLVCFSFFGENLSLFANACRSSIKRWKRKRERIHLEKGLLGFHHLLYFLILQFLTRFPSFIRNITLFPSLFHFLIKERQAYSSGSLIKWGISLRHFVRNAALKLKRQRTTWSPRKDSLWQDILEEI